MGVAVLEVVRRRDQRPRRAQVTAQIGPSLATNFLLMTLPCPPSHGQSGRYMPAPSTAKTGSMPCCLHSRKSSSPWSGDMWTSPVPASVVTKSPGSIGRGRAIEAAEVVHRMADGGAGEFERR